MIDLHCHYLPGVDDGCRSMEESVAIIRIAQAEGITRAVITPHMHPGVYDNQLDNLAPVFSELKTTLRKQGIAMRLALAAEVRLSTELLTDLPAGRVPFIGKLEGKDVVLLELPYSHIPPGTDKLLRWMRAQGVTAMIAHPERNREIIAEPASVLRLKDAGAKLQLTISSFIGEFGEKVQDVAEWLLVRECADIVASDAHRPSRRPPLVKPGLDRIAKLVGAYAMRELSDTVPAIISKPLFGPQKINVLSSQRA